MGEIGKHIERAADLLRQEQVIGIPTETVYGLAGNALSTKAVSRIFAVKNRPHFNPLIIHIGTLESLEKYVRELPSMAYELANTFWPGPMTLLLPKSEKVPDLVTAGSDRVAIRIPSHPLTLDLLQSLDFPLAAPSANPFGYISPTTAHHVAQQLGEKIPYILDGGDCKVGLESTIVGFDEQDKPLIYREGGLGREDVEKVVGKLGLAPKKNENQPESSGRLKSHYAPNKKLVLGDLQKLISAYKKENFVVLSFFQYYPNIDPKRQFILSPEKDLHEAASKLFTFLREMDEMDIDYILAEEVPDVGLGRAINDRLGRAQAIHK